MKPGKAGLTRSREAREGLSKRWHIGTLLSLLSLLAALSAAGPARANHDWIGQDLCRAYPERMPPPLDSGVLPDPGGAGARILGRYCNQCHQAPGPGQHNAAEWAEVLARMDLLMDVTARFGDRPRPIESPDPAERAILLAYLQGHALRPLADLSRAPPAYRSLCGDCHAAPNPTAYAHADWPALLARMAGHRRVMGRAPGDPAAQAKIEAYLGVSSDAPLVTGQGDPSLDVAWGHPSGRWFALGPFFVLAVLGLGRWWWRHHREGRT
jgi:cytochrome c5